MTIPLQIASLYSGQFPCWILARTSSLVTWSLFEMRSILREHLISKACILLRSSAVRVHDSQGYRKMNVTRERISRILELREMLLSFQTGFSHVNAAVFCAIPESISGLEPSAIIAEPRGQVCCYHRVKKSNTTNFKAGRGTQCWMLWRRY